MDIASTLWSVEEDEGYDKLDPPENEGQLQSSFSDFEKVSNDTKRLTI